MLLAPFASNCKVCKALEFGREAEPTHALLTRAIFFGAVSGDLTTAQSNLGLNSAGVSNGSSSQISKESSISLVSVSGWPTAEAQSHFPSLASANQYRVVLSDSSLWFSWCNSSLALT